MSARSALGRTARSSKSATPRTCQTFRSSAFSRNELSARDQSTGSASQAHASSSNLSSQPTTRYKQRPDETVQEAWKRNMQEVRNWRRSKAAQASSIPLYLPPSHQQPKRSPQETSLSTLLASGAALGHSTSLLNPFYTPYVYGNRSGISVIDLDQTLPILRRTANMVREVVQADGVILIVGTREAHERVLNKAKARLGDNGFVVGDWLPGTLTNSETFFGIEPIREGSYVPDVVIFLNPSENLSAIRECTLKNIPTVGIVDTDSDPRLVTYPIPANMESVRTADLIISTLSIAGQEGRRLRMQSAMKEKTGRRA